MMKTLKVISYLFYRYYSKGGTKAIPYFSTICALVLLLSLHIFQFLVIFNGMSLVGLGSNAEPGSARLIKYLKIALLTSPLFLLFSFLIKKSELQSMHYSETKIRRGYIYLVIYIVFSFSLLMFLALLKKGRL